MANKSHKPLYKTYATKIKWKINDTYFACRFGKRDRATLTFQQTVGTGRGVLQGGPEVTGQFLIVNHF